MSKMQFILESGKLKIQNNEVNLPYKVAEVIEINSSLIVRLEIPINEIYNRNVFCFNLNGNLLWQISEAELFGHKESSYVSIINDGSGGLLSETFFGAGYQVNLENGLVTSKYFRRF